MKLIFAENLLLGNWTIHLPSIVPYVAMAGILLFTLSILPGLIWIERVLLALIQDRSGPNRVGPRGLLQPTADVLKLFFKEDSRPKNVDVRIYYLAPIMAIIPAFAASAVFPVQFLSYYKDAVFSLTSGQFTAMGHGIITMPVMIGNVNIGLLYILALSSLQTYGTVLAGWSSNNKYSLLGGLRASAQLISYELSMGLALLCVILMAGSLNLADIVRAQDILPFAGAPEFLRGSVITWFWLRSLIVPVVIYTIAMIAETNRVPFDLPEAESELVAGFFTEYTSMKFAMFFTAEYVSMLIVSGLNASVFWGGPLPPINLPPFNWIPGFIWFILKVMFGIFFYVWLRGTLPRLRYDALMGLGWKKMLPTALVWVFVIAGLTLAVDTVMPTKNPNEIKMPTLPMTRVADVKANFPGNTEPVHHIMLSPFPKSGLQGTGAAGGAAPTRAPQPSGGPVTVPVQSGGQQPSGGPVTAPVPSNSPGHVHAVPVPSNGPRSAGGPAPSGPVPSDKTGSGSKPVVPVGSNKPVEPHFSDLPERTPQTVH